MKNILLFILVGLAAEVIAEDPAAAAATPGAEAAAPVHAATPGASPAGAPAEDPTAATYIETSATLQFNGQVCSTPKGKMLSGVRSQLTSRLEGVQPKTSVSIDVLPVIENGKIKYKMTILMEKANGDSSKVTADGITDPTVPLKYAFGKEGSAYNAEVIFTLAGNRP